MRSLLILSLLLCPFATARAQVSVEFGAPVVDIGIHVPAYPELVVIPGYPVYYAPHGDSNYFFYDGLYWVYVGDAWYSSSWYNGPWRLVAPEYVPAFVLRVPVRYYLRPPVYFRGWVGDAPPHWGEHWGHAWEERRLGWDHWDRSSSRAPAPLPAYQRQYSGTRYPHSAEHQAALRSANYHYQPHETVTRQQFQQHVASRAETHPQESVRKAPAPHPLTSPSKAPAEPQRHASVREPSSPQHASSAGAERQTKEAVQQPHASPQPHAQPAQPKHAPQQAAHAHSAQTAPEQRSGESRAPPTAASHEGKPEEHR